MAIVNRLVILSCMPLLHCQGGAACDPITAETHARVEQYVKKLLKVPDTSALDLTAWSTEAESCFRKLDFSIDGASRFVLHLSPDQRFLTPQLLDSTVDPEKAEAEEAARISGRINSYLATHDAPILGRKGAPITIAWFSDFQCPFCRNAAQILTREMLPAYGEQVQLVYLHYPLSSHPWARPAAEAAACLHESPLFWKVAEFLFGHQAELNPGNLRQAIIDYVRTLPEGEVDTAKFGACIGSNVNAARVDDDSALGEALNVSATPTLFINGERLVGVTNAGEIERAISRQIKAGRGSLSSERSQADSEYKGPGARSPDRQDDKIPLKHE